jgi:ribosome recycling factor
MIMSEEVQMCLEMAKEQMQQSMEHLEAELGKIRAGKASPALVNHISLDYYGVKSPLSQVANISTPDAKTITIQPWEKNMLDEIEKAILAANIGLTPQNNGESIRLFIPPLTEERRIDLVKQVKQLGEHGKVSIRNCRKQANDEIKQQEKDGLSEDMAKGAEAQIQVLTDQFAKDVEKYTDAKEQEIMTV